MCPLVQALAAGSRCAGSTSNQRRSKLDPIASAMLGAVECGIRPAKPALDVFAIFEHSSANRDGDRFVGSLEFGANRSMEFLQRRFQACQISMHLK